MSESNPQTPFTGLGGSLGCMVHSQTQREREGGRGMDTIKDGEGKMEKRHGYEDRYGETYKC